MANTIHTPAISRIISNAGVKKSVGTGYNTGFECIGLGPVVQVHYTPRQIDNQAEILEHIANLLNTRSKYTAQVVGNIVEVRMTEQKTDEEIREERMEQAAEESPYAVTKCEVNNVLEGPCYPYTEGTAGYVINRAEAPHDRLVRVEYKDHPHTSYALVEGGREQYIKDSVKLYADKLRAAGFSVAVEGDYESVLVGQPGEFPSEDDPQEVKAALNALREAVEDDGPSYMTRRAGNHSIFVYYLVPFKDKVRRLEIFRSEGVYRVHGRFGGVAGRSEDVAGVLPIVRSELAD